ncbi:MAG: trigger factor [Fimbriimonas sp.]|nr:trigger factor [Fimbriimonas sp.]
MQVTRQDLNPCTVSLEIVCDPEQVKEGFERALKQIAKSIKLPGFRPGHAPRAMVEGLIPKEELFDKAAEIIVRNSFKAALEQEKIDPDQTTRPTVELKLLDNVTQVAEYTVKVPLPPKITLGEYKGLPIQKPEVAVTDDEVEKQIEEFRKRKQTREAVTDRGVQEGDVAVVNVKIEGEGGDGRNFMTIAGQTFPQLDSALMGMKVEDMKNLEVTFPETFQEKDWCGKTFNIQITLNSLSGVKLPELDDTFAQSLKTDNVEDLRTRVRDSIKRAKEQMLHEMVNEQLLERLHERSQVFVSDNMWEALAERRMRETSEEQKKENKTLEMYAAENGMTIEQLREAWNEKAKLHVERALMIREVFVAEQMALTTDELNDELYSMAQEYGIEAAEMWEMLKKNEAVDELHFRAISRKVADFLESHAEATAAA